MRCIVSHILKYIFSIISQIQLRLIHRHSKWVRNIDNKLLLETSLGKGRTSVDAQIIVQIMQETPYCVRASGRGAYRDRGNPVHCIHSCIQKIKFFTFTIQQRYRVYQITGTLIQKSNTNQITLEKFIKILKLSRNLLAKIQFFVILSLCRRHNVSENIHVLYCKAQVHLYL